ncbi:MAG: baseplate J/gp47 family protein, partial [Lachnospiraceae bacterium]|nr:baseplate J/gp47 family protein [Lachnospiraceae bacterium]
GAEIVTLSYRAKMALLKMAGFVPTKGKCARILLSGDDLPGLRVLPSGTRFHLGDLCFETNKEIRSGACRFTGVYTKDDDGFHDMSFILDRELSVPAKLFGDAPEKGASLYLVFEGDVSDLKEAILYAEMSETKSRNLTEDRTEHIFADTDWELFTDHGFVKISARDFTGGFVRSGELRLSFPDRTPVVYKDTPKEGYVFRVTLSRAQYDVVPRILGLSGFLFEAWQKDTKAFSQSFSRPDQVTVHSPIGENVYYLVFGREQKGSSYRRYELSVTGNQKGRYCTFENTDPTTITFTFHPDTMGYAPVKGKDCVRVIVYGEEIMRRYSVGKVIGYDDQEIELPVRNIVHESFFLIARRKDEEGYRYDFVRPEKKGPGALYYHLLEGDGKIIIEEAGDFIDADLFMGSVALTEGPRGNISSGNRLRSDEEKLSFYNPGAGTGGAFRENLEQVRARFLKDMNTVYRAVTAKDYEDLVKTTPGLCIRKAKAFRDESENRIRLAVLPDSEERFPKLSDIYIDRITKRIEDRRLITSAFTIMKPVFVAIGVRCTVYVKRHYGDCREKIEERIRTCVDYIRSDHNFGDKLRFEDVFYAIEELACVDYVYELSLHSENGKLAKLKDYDIYPRQDCLCYPGEIRLEIVTAELG